MCGENGENIVVGVHCWGSSPRVRGKHGTAGRLLPRPGLIPACAGKTQLLSTQTRQHRAHPRVCGENFEKLFVYLKKEGSSPRVRGKPITRPDGHSGSGLIPACAGKTFPNGWAGPVSEAHPRVCGENPSIGSVRSSIRGSSPRVRGKPRIQ